MHGIAEQEDKGILWHTVAFSRTPAINYAFKKREEVKLKSLVHLWNSASSAARALSCALV